VEVGFENAAQVLLHDAYVRFEDRPEAQNRYLSSLVREMWGRLDRGEVSVSGVALGLSQAASTQHLKFYVKDRRAEAALREAGFDGTFRGRGSNVQFLWHNNLAANKVDYFLRRSIDITVVLTQGGDAKVLSAVSLQNSAPKGPPSELIGSGVGGDEPGLNRMQLNLLLPQEADIDRYVLDGRIRPLLEDEEAGFPVLWDIIDIPSRTTVTLQVAYTLRDAVDLTSGRGAFKMILFPQALAVPDRYSVRVVPPYEYAINYPTQGHLEDDGSLLQRGSLSRETAISAELTRR
jgi:hypothetical protein